MLNYICQLNQVGKDVEELCPVKLTRNFLAIQQHTIDILSYIIDTNFCKNLRVREHDDTK